MRRRSAESYEAAAKLLKVMGYDINQISSGELIGLKSRIENMSKLADELGIGTMTLEDIVKELESREEIQEMKCQSRYLEKMFLI